MGGGGGVAAAAARRRGSYLAVGCGLSQPTARTSRWGPPAIDRPRPYRCLCPRRRGEEEDKTNSINATRTTTAAAAQT
jgi:hypothetical protein